MGFPHGPCLVSFQPTSRTSSLHSLTRRRRKPGEKPSYSIVLGNDLHPPAPPLGDLFRHATITCPFLLAGPRYLTTIHTLFIWLKSRRHRHTLFPLKDRALGYFNSVCTWCSQLATPVVPESSVAISRHISERYTLAPFLVSERLHSAIESLPFNFNISLYIIGRPARAFKL